METLALILAGGKGSRLDLLSQRRSKPAVPFAGKYRIIDFTLTNCTSSGIFNIGILTQYLPFSLNEHIGAGKPWDLDRRDSGVVLLQPHSYWYEGTADAVLKNINYIKRNNAKYVLILSGDHVYKMDYRLMINEHEKNGAELTIATIKVAKDETDRFGMLKTNEGDQIIDFIEKPKETDLELASMGIYLFNRDLLIEALETVKEVDLDFGKHIIPYLIKSKGAKVFAYRFNDYWRDVGTYDSYLETNLELIDEHVLDLYDEKWTIHTRSEEKPPVKVEKGAKIENSLLSNGCIIKGEVINSVLSPGVYVGKGAKVINSVILNDTHIGEGSIVDTCILDKKVVIGNNVMLGHGDDYTANIERPDILASGITVLEKHAEIPSDTTVGRNCRIFGSAKVTDKIIKSGTTLS